MPAVNHPDALPTLKGDREVFYLFCKNKFGALPVMPDGEVLSYNGFVRAAERAAIYYLREIKMLDSSARSSSVSKTLNNAASVAALAAENMENANNLMKSLERLMRQLPSGAFKRILDIPAPIIHLLNESTKYKKTLLHKSSKEIFEILNKTKLNDLDVHFIRSEVMQFIESKDDSGHLNLISIEMIDKIKSIYKILLEAKKLKLVANTRGGGQRVYREFRMHPNHLLIRECMAILEASGLPNGRKKDGLLQKFSESIRDYAEGSQARKLQHSIENFPNAKKRHDPEHETWIKFRRLCLLGEDLGSHSKKSKSLSIKLKEINNSIVELKMYIENQIKIKLKNIDNKNRYTVEKGPIINLDECSPFG